MKPHRLRRIPLFLAFIFATGGTGSAQAMPSVCEDVNFATCLQLLLQQRCATYADYNLFSKREFRCESSVLDMVDLFSPFNPKGEINVVAFPKQIGALLLNPKAFAFLSQLPAAVDSAVAAGQTFRLWNYAVKKANGDELAALEWIAVFLQDTSMGDGSILLDFASVGYDTNSERKLTLKERNTLQNAIKAVSYQRLADKSADSDAMYIRAYPKIDTEFLSEGFYHFYFSAYIARALQTTRGSVTESGKDMNGFAPFLLNAVYEMHENIDRNLSFIKDAKPFSTQSKSLFLRDLYAGYVGSLFGLGGSALVAKAEPFASFSKRFARNPTGTMKSLYLNFRPR